MRLKITLASGLSVYINNYSGSRVFRLQQEAEHFGDRQSGPPGPHLEPVRGRQADQDTARSPHRHL